MLICGCVAKAPLWSQRATWGCRASRQGKGKRRKFMISSLEQRALRDMNTFTLGPRLRKGAVGAILMEMAGKLLEEVARDEQIRY